MNIYEYKNYIYGCSISLILINLTIKILILAVECSFNNKLCLLLVTYD